jgi:hypothetical protein
MPQLPLMFSRLRDERDQLEAMLRWGAGPLIAGLQPASLLCIPAPFSATWERERSTLCDILRVSVFCLRESLVLLYRRGPLARKTSAGASAHYLASLGYPVSTGLSACLTALKSRFDNPASFPHEVGVFLGYPLEDVIHFSAGHPAPYHCRGYWQVYHRPDRAKRAFAYMDAARSRVVRDFLARASLA